MSIESIAAQYSPTVKTASTAASSTLGKDDFLQLLVAQLQQQDPLNPQDPTEFTSQLTQYSSLEQLMSVNDNLTSLGSQQALGSNLSAAGFIGKTARVSGDQVKVSGGAASTLQYDVPLDSAKTTVKIYDAAGKLVDTIELGASEAGTHDFQWDGTLASGSQAVDGTYHMEFVAADSTGAEYSVDTSLSGLISGVSFENGQTLFKIGDQGWPLSSILSIEND